jgi:hypothetical protein
MSEQIGVYCRRFIGAAMIDHSCSGRVIAGSDSRILGSALTEAPRLNGRGWSDIGMSRC